jgi:hypothetical protein
MEASKSALQHDRLEKNSERCINDTPGAVNLEQGENDASLQYGFAPRRQQDVLPSPFRPLPQIKPAHLKTVKIRASMSAIDA